MLFGNKADFAIEAMIEPGLIPPSMPWGRLCVWVAGIRIGDYDNPHCSLWNSHVGFQEKCKEFNRLWLDKFDNLGDVAIWDFLDGILYGWHGNVEVEDNRTLEEMVEDSAKYGRFDFLTNWGEMFDRGGKSFILKPPNGLIKILNYDSERNVVNSYVCSEFSFHHASREFSDWYLQQAKRLNSW